MRFFPYGLVLTSDVRIWQKNRAHMSHKGITCEPHAFQADWACGHQYLTKNRTCLCSRNLTTRPSTFNTWGTHGFRIPRASFLWGSLLWLAAPKCVPTYAARRNPSKFRRRMCHMWTTCDTHACGQKSPENLIEFYLINACGKHVGSMWTRVGNWS